jgi:amino acid adenylation domain-containing protein
MSDSAMLGSELPPDQQGIRDKCFHRPGEVVEFSRTDAEQSIPVRFEKIVKLFPHRLAVRVGERSLTYDELNRYSDHIAQAILEARGPGSEPVALLLAHGVDAIATILGVLKAGKAYVVLNESFPMARNHYIADDSEASLIITNDDHLTAARELTTRHRTLLRIDTIGQFSHQATGMSVQPEALASILYTSGSTGQPKGVFSTHRSVLRGRLSTTDKLQITTADRLTLLHSLSFGSAQYCFFRSLLNGAALFPFDIKSNGVHRLSDWLEKEEITVLHAPPSAFRQLAQSLSGRERFRHLRFIRLSGAPITRLDFEIYKKHFDPRTLFVFGMSSTETRGICSAVVNQTFSFPEQGSPVGYPVAGKKILLLNENGEVVAPGEIGEIAVKARNLNSGYWKLPESIAAKFLPAPDQGDERIYMTGDLGKMLPDGFLIHMGRKDFMVKIRSYRVDLSEIERALSSHPLIKDAGVMAWDREPGEKYLAAYVVVRQQGTLTTKEVYQFLRDSLPDYMIPSVIKFLDALPLTNGKLDRRALPKLDHKRPDLGAIYVQPRNQVEEQLAQLWAKVLSLDKVGIYDNFFDLGGHSLLAVRLVSEMEKRIGRQISVATFLKSPTVAQLARELPTQENLAPSPLIAVQPNGSKPPFFCVHGTDSYGRLAQDLGPDQPFFGLAQHLEGRKVRHTRIEDIAAYYLRKIRTVQSAGPYYIGGHSIGGLIAFEMAQQLKQQQHEIALLVLLDSGAPRSQRAVLSDPSMVSHAKRRLRDKFFTVRWTAKEKLLKGAKTAACEFYHRLGMPLPPSLRTFYVDQVVYGRIYAKAHRSYMPLGYSGRAVYVKSEDTRERITGWEKLITRGLEVRSVTGNHFSMLTEPNLKSLAQTLKECLTEAQESARTSSQSCKMSDQAQYIENAQFENVPERWVFNRS